jgi:hypothetical protein
MLVDYVIDETPAALQRVGANYIAVDDFIGTLVHSHPQCWNDDGADT